MEWRVDCAPSTKAWQRTATIDGIVGVAAERYSIQNSKIREKIRSTIRCALVNQSDHNDRALQAIYDALVAPTGVDDETLEMLLERVHD